MIVSLLMASCSSTKINSTYSEDVLVKCEKIAKDGRYKDFGEVWIKLNEVTDMQMECAKRHNTLVDQIRKTQ
jgi:hypothetical protein